MIEFLKIVTAFMAAGAWILFGMAAFIYERSAIGPRRRNADSWARGLFWVAFPLTLAMLFLIALDGGIES